MTNLMNDTSCFLSMNEIKKQNLIAIDFKILCAKIIRLYSMRPCIVESVTMTSSNFNTDYILSDGETSIYLSEFCFSVTSRPVEAASFSVFIWKQSGNVEFIFDEKDNNEKRIKERQLDLFDRVMKEKE